MKVYAGCLTSKGIQEIISKGSPEIIPLLCDITNDRGTNIFKFNLEIVTYNIVLIIFLKNIDINYVASIVSNSSPDGLYALVNNSYVLNFYFLWLLLLFFLFFYLYLFIFVIFYYINL